MRTKTLLLLVVTPAFIAAACGNDTRSKLIQVGDPVDNGHLFEPGTDGHECLTSAACEDGDPCTENRCVDKACVSFALPSEQCCETETLFAEGFDDGTAGALTFTQLNGAAGWHVIGERAASPPGALYFGDPQQLTYNVGAHVAGEVSLPALDLPRDRESALSMRLYALIETSPEFDLFRVEADVIVAGEVAETRTLLDKRDLPVSAYEDFALVTVPLEGLAGRRVVVRIGFDSVDAMNNAYEGVWIDDLSLAAGCPLPGECATDADCDDGDPCTAEVCAEIGCISTLICELPDPDPIVDVETDPCAVPGAPADCCTSDADCDDGNPATVNVCDGATCAVTLNPDLCTSDASCDDGEPCTTETCNGEGVCEYLGTVGAGCCVPGTLRVADFDNETLQGLYVTDNLEAGVFWTPDKTRATGGQFSLYCGDPVSQTYAAPHRVKSSATTRPLAVPAGGTTQIVFDLYKATRTAVNYDVFTVFILRDGALLPAWSSKSLDSGTTGGAWQRVVVPLTAYAGQDVQVRFVFDSIDRPTGGFEGVYIDSISLETGCH